MGAAVAGPERPENVMLYVSVFPLMVRNPDPVPVVVMAVGRSAAPLIATIDAMLNDSAAYATHAAHFGGPPAG